MYKQATNVRDELQDLVRCRLVAVPKITYYANRLPSYFKMHAIKQNKRQSTALFVKSRERSGSTTQRQ